MPEADSSGFQSAGLYIPSIDTGLSKTRKQNALYRVWHAINKATKLDWRETAWIKDSPNHRLGDSLDLAPPHVKGYAHTKNSDPVLHKREALLRDLMTLAATWRLKNDDHLSVLIAIENNHLHVQIIKDALLDGQPIAPGTIIPIPWGSDRSDLYPDSRQRNEAAMVPGTSNQSNTKIKVMREEDLSGDFLPGPQFATDIELVETGDVIDFGDPILPFPTNETGDIDNGEIGDLKSAKRLVAASSQKRIMKRAAATGNTAKASKAIVAGQKVASAVKLANKVNGKLEAGDEVPFIQVMNGKVVSVNGIRWEAKSRARDIAYAIQNQRAFQPFKNYILGGSIGASTTFNVTSVMPASATAKVWAATLIISSTALAQNAGKIFTVSVYKVVNTVATLLYTISVQFVDNSKPMTIVLLPCLNVDGNYYHTLVDLDNNTTPADVDDFRLVITGGDGTYDTASIVIPGCEDPYTKQVEATIL